MPSTDVDRAREASLSIQRVAFNICLVVLGVAGLVYFIFQTWLAVMLTLAAAMVATAMDRLVRSLVRRGWRRSWAIALVIGSALALFVALGVLLVPPVLGQIRALIETAPELAAKLRDSRTVVDLRRRLGIESSGAAGQVVKNAVGPLLGAAQSVVSVLTGLLTVFALSVLMLVFSPSLFRSMLDELSATRRARVERLLQNSYDAVSGYLGGLFIVCGVNAGMAATFLALLRVPFFLPLGLLSGLLNVIPYAGSALSAIVIGLVALATGGWVKALEVVAYFALYFQLQGSVIEPTVYRHTIHTNPLVTTLAALFLAQFAGVFGAILAVPCVVIAQVLLREWQRLRREREAASAIP